MSYWKDRRVLVTGGAGFVGGHLLRALKQAGADVFSADHKWDLRERNVVQQMFAWAYPVDLLFHLAARVGGIGANREHPAEFYRDNILMNTHVIHTARAMGTGKVVTLGSVCAYPKYTPAPFVEENLWCGYPEETNAPYGVTKRALLVQLQAYRQQYGLDGVMLVPTNLYGPGDHFEPERSHVIPALIKKFSEAQAKGEPKVELWGTGTASRDFLYVGDAVAALLLAAEKYDEPEPLNLGSGFECPIAELASMVKRLVGYEGAIEWNAAQPDGQPRRVLNSGAAMHALGWKAQTPLEEGLRKTIEWYRGQIKWRSCF